MPQCPDCGAPLIPMLLSSVCARECDLRPKDPDWQQLINALGGSWLMVKMFYAGQLGDDYVDCQLVQGPAAGMSLALRKSRILDGTAIKLAIQENGWAFEGCPVKRD